MDETDVSVVVAEAAAGEGKAGLRVISTAPFASEINFEGPTSYQKCTREESIKIILERERKMVKN